MTRRQTLGAGAAATTALLAPTLFAGHAAAQTVDVDELMKAGPLGEKAQGADDAKLTLIEYASMDDDKYVSVAQCGSLAPVESTC